MFPPLLRPPFGGLQKLRFRAATDKTSKRIAATPVGLCVQ